jgi:hypothetical protein
MEARWGQAYRGEQSPTSLQRLQEARVFATTGLSVFLSDSISVNCATKLPVAPVEIFGNGLALNLKDEEI